MDNNWFTNMVDTCHNLPQLILGKGDKTADYENLGDSTEMPEPEAELANHDCEPDNFLRGQFLGLGRAERLHDGQKIALSYWRHGAQCACRHSQDEDLKDILHPQSPYAERLGNGHVRLDGDLEAPGMGLEMECLTSFLARSTKEQMIHDYHLQSSGVGSRTSFDGYSEFAESLNDHDFSRLESANQSEDVQEDSVYEHVTWEDDSQESPEVVDEGPVPEEEFALAVDAPADLEAGIEERERLITCVEESLASVRDALSQLAHDPDEHVRAVVAQEVYCPSEALSDLSHDASAEVRMGVASNPNAPLDILEELSFDDDPKVAHIARQAKQQFLQPQVWSDSSVSSAA